MLLWRAAPRYMDRRGWRLTPALLEAIKRHRVIFVHIPKTGGTSIATALFGGRLGHRRWSEWRALHPEKFAQYLKFAVVRDPVDRFLSEYDHFQRRAAGTTRERTIRDRFVIPAGSAERFALRLAADRAWRRRLLDAGRHFHAQSSFVLSRKSRVMVDRLIDFGHLDEDLRALIDLPALEHLNACPGERARREDLGPHAIEALRQVYRQDFALYDFARIHRGSDVFGARLPAWIGVPAPDLESATAVAWPASPAT